jgi:hypothetical protein
MSTASHDSATASSETAASQLGQLRAVNEALQRFVDQRSTRAAAAEGQAPAAPAQQPLEQQLAELSARYGNLERQLDAARADAAERSALSGLSAAERALLVESRTQNESLREQLATARTAEEQLRTTLAQFQFDRQAALAELHVLRCRTMELAEELSRERQHSLAERQVWHNELSHWRRLLESHFVRLSGNPRVPPDPRTLDGLDLTSPATDVALNSVLQMIEHQPQSDT